MKLTGGFGITRIKPGDGITRLHRYRVTVRSIPSPYQFMTLREALSWIEFHRYERRSRDGQD